MFIEPLLDADKPVCIIDPKGDHWGLKSSADGKKAGYSVVIFGGKHGDVPINEKSGAHIAELIATENRPCIIDLGGWMVQPRTRFFIDFASNFFRLAVGLRWLVIDECHNFAPQGKVLDPDSGKMLHWANRLASEGSGKGITLVSASQRPQKVHKDYVTSHETLIAKRVIHPLDRGAVKEWIDGCGDPTMGREVLNTLALMERDEGWIWSPEINFGPRRIHVPLFKTYDSFKPQPISQKKLKGWAEIDLDDVTEKLADVIEEHKANDPAELRRRIVELERQLREWPKEILQAASKVEVQRVEVPVIKNGHLRQAEKIVAGMEKAIGRLSPTLQVLQEGLHKVSVGAEAGKRQTMTASTIKLPPTFGQIRLPGPKKPAPIVVSSGGALPKGEAAILTACIQFPEGLLRAQLTVLTGYKRSSRDAYIARLKEKGAIETSHELVKATAIGIAMLPEVEPLPTGEALQVYWLERLPEGEKRILQILIAAYPNAVRREEIDELTGYKRSSRDAFLSRVAAKQLIDEPQRGMVRASEYLF